MNHQSQSTADAAYFPKQRHHLGWQITGKCNHACRYCLRRRTDRPTFELGKADCAKILESYLDFVVANSMTASIMYSGGNPLLRPDLPSLLQRTFRAKQENIVEHVSILANPETLDVAMIAAIAESQVDLVFLSLDGRKENNDRMRGSGSFDAAIAGIRKLSDAGVTVNVKYTLSRYNLHDVAYTRELVTSLGAKHMAVGILSRPDDAGDLSDLLLTPPEYREYLLEELQYFDAMPEECREKAEEPMRFHRGLFALLFYELGRYDEFQKRVHHNLTRSGMWGLGPMRDGRRREMFVVWEDGSVHASNPNAQPPLGQVPQESFQTIHERRKATGIDLTFPHSRNLMLPLNSTSTSETCQTCPVHEYCRGDNRYCWKLN